MARRGSTGKRGGAARAVARTKVWFEVGGSHVFGRGLARLLESVDRLGTLRAAAGEVKMSYRYAWELIRVAERHLGKALIVRRAGGLRGGASALTADGEHMLGVFRRLNEEVAAFADDRFEALCKRENADA